MIELTEEYKRKGFYIVSPIFYKERVYKMWKCKRQ